jgi:hypothetical protein
MNSSSTPPRGRAPKLSSDAAQARLADALRENLKRRKAQARARVEQPEGQRDHQPVAPTPQDADKPGGKSR